MTINQFKERHAIKLTPETYSKEDIFEFGYNVAIHDVCEFILNCKYQSLENEKDRNCLLLNIEKLYR